MNSTQSAIPLVLPNNSTWDEQTGYQKKPDVERTALEVIPKALDQLREIKGPVCVVSIAGPCRKGKSYILCEAFDQGEVFPLGHLLDPETMGIWLWVVPQKFQDSTGRDFTVVLLDSEGVDSVYAKQTDDHKIFTLSVLLSSILIYNSAGVPGRGDLEGLDFIVKLSQRIQLHTNQETAATREDESHFYKTFPKFLWLLRDVVLKLPPEIDNYKDYFLERVFNTKGKETSEGEKNTAKSILRFFSEFDAFTMPPPAYDPEVVQNLNKQEFKSQANPKFFKAVERFKEMLRLKLAPKKSINEGEMMTGEALAAMVQLFVEALNTPGTVPNVQNAWDTFVHTKCTEVLATALTTYKQEMTSQLQDKIPCEADVIGAVHLKAVDAALAIFRQETLNLSSTSVENYLNQLTEKMENIHSKWLKENEQETDIYCTNLLQDLKKTILDQVFTRLRGPDGSTMDFKDIVGAHSEMEKTYFDKARGDHNIRAAVYMRLNQAFQDEMNRNLNILQKLKDYDATIIKEKAEKAALEQQKQMVVEQNKRLEEERKTREKEMTMLREKLENDRVILEKAIKDDMEAHKKQMKDFQKAWMDEMVKEREERHKQHVEILQQQAKDKEMELKRQLEKERRDKDEAKEMARKREIELLREKEKERRDKEEAKEMALKREIELLREKEKERRDKEEAKEMARKREIELLREKEKERRDKEEAKEMGRKREIELLREREKDREEARNKKIQLQREMEQQRQFAEQEKKELRNKAEKAKKRTRLQNFFGVFTGE